MAEKRKLPARDRRESAAKRRVSEATPQSHKKKAPTPRAPSPELVDAPLPTKVKDGDPLPIVRTRQALSLSDNEYQSIAESAVLLASLERSKKKWLSDGILVRYYTKPKKTKREQIEKNNPSKDTMAKIGPCDVTIGPHFFDATIYIVKDPSAPPALQYAPPQRPMVHYGHPNNFQQYRPYPTSSNQQRPAQYSPAPPGRPGYTGSHPSPQQARGPNAPSPQGGQKPPQGQKSQPAKPSPDPVIQMLATRAAADPELKALMRVVASSQASQEQLRAFQAHIDELNAIIKSREQQEHRQQSSAGQPITQQSTPTPQPQTQTQKQQHGGTKSVSLEKSPQTSQTPSKGPKQPPLKTETQPPTPAQAPPSQAPKPPQSATGSTAAKEEQSATEHSTSQSAPSEAARPVVPTPSATPGAVSTPAATSTTQQQTPVVNPTPPASAQQPGARPGPPYAPHQQPSYGSQPPLQSRPPQFATPVPFTRPPSISYVSPLGSPPINYKSVVFEFTSPLTPYGSSTSGHAGSGDRYLFPEYTILEWLPAENTVIASFLVVRKVPPNTTFPLETATEAANSKSKGKGASKAKKSEPKVKIDKDKLPTDSPAPSQPCTPTTGTPQKQEPTDQTGLLTPGLAGTPANEANFKEYWQPVTFRIHAPNAKILEPLARVVKPADEVRKYMNDIMDRAERAPDGYLAMRLPREVASESFQRDGTPASSGNIGSGTRSRLSRVQLAGDETEGENSGFEFEEDEEDLKDFYDAPSGLPPLKA
ncbi:uncharacterized protein N7518_008595 [Penicillium psychrosexuale]|uniref:uncharacterized protein n=1 Tax=Penicillium psychrosexuale TaxID=1002107 RepID=UPI00254564B5|nr:uncharacterized protein N7518_008595 [Penicillium psychrosexuale]KAJ5791584.1 hypothetical protein N7518_008595 [Penicillium psychrosexuale]